MNEYRGEVALELAGQTYTLRYTWGAVLELRRVFGPEFDQRISDAILTLDLESVAKALAVGLQDSWQGCTSDDVLKASPPIGTAFNTLQNALRVAFHGPGEVMAKPDARPTLAPLRRLAGTLSRWLQWPRWKLA